jgi:hypothetical protein
MLQNLVREWRVEMTLLYVEGFGGVDSTTLADKYVIVSAPIVGTATAGRQNTRSCVSNSNNEYIRFVLDAETAIVMGFAIRFTEGTTSPNQIIIRSYSGGDFEQLRLERNGNGVMTLLRGTVVLVRGTRLIKNDHWYYMELKATINSSTGSYELKIEGVTEFSDTGVNTGAQSEVSRIDFGAQGSNNDIEYTDIYILNHSGSAPLNDFLGDVNVESLFPDGNGTTNNFTPSAGSNFENVDESPPHDSDSTYNSAGTATDRDLYTFDNITAPVSAVRAVALNLTLRREAGSTRSVKDVVRSGGSNFDGQGSMASLAPGADYETFNTIHETDPNTAAAWTEANVNAAEFGVLLDT